MDNDINNDINTLTTINDNLVKINITLLKMVKVLENTSKVYEDNIALMRAEQKVLLEKIEYDLKRFEIRLERY